MNTKTQIHLLVLIGLVFGLSAQAFAKDPIYTGFFSSTAIGGYDTVSYFQGDGIPQEGLEEFQAEWLGANWYFANAENLATFKENPEQYAPQYGGYCAWAVSQDSLAKGDPMIYQIVGEKLYLNYNEDISEKWSPRKEELIPIADSNYPDLVDFD